MFNFNLQSNPNLFQGTYNWNDVRKEYLSPGRVERLTDKIHMALGEESPGQEIIRQHLDTTGDDSIYRDQIQQKEVATLENTRNVILNELAATGDFEAVANEFGPIATFNAVENATPYDVNIEKVAADKMTDFIFSWDDYSPAFKFNRDYLGEAAHRNVSDTIASVSYAQELLKDLEYEKENQGTVGWSYDFAKSLIGFPSWANLSNAIKGQKFGSWLLGNNLEEQLTYLNTLPLNERKEAIKRTYEDLKASSLIDAESWLQYVISFSSSDKFWASFEHPIFDVASTFPFATAGRLVKAGKQAVINAAEEMGIKDYAKGVAKGAARGDNVDLGKVAAETGNNVGVATSKVVDEFENPLLKIHRNKELKHHADGAFSVTNTAKFFQGASGTDAAIVQRIGKNAAARFNRVWAELQDSPIVERLANLEGEIQNQLDDWANEFNSGPGSVVNIADAPKSLKDPISNVTRIAIQIGKNDGTLFPYENNAKAYAAKWLKLKSDDYVIKKAGDMYYIEAYRLLDESKGFERGLKGATLPTDHFNHSLLNQTLLGTLKGTGTVVKGDNMGKRILATQGAARMKQLLETIGKPLIDLPKKQRDELLRVFEKNQTGLDPYLLQKDQKKKGFFYRTVQDFEEGFYDLNGKLPTPEQIDAYAAYISINDTEHYLRNVGMFRDVIAIGGKKLTTKIKIGKETQTIVGEGKVIDELPEFRGTETQYQILMINEDGTAIHKNNRLFGKKLRAIMDDIIANGGRIYKTIDTTKPFTFVDGKGKPAIAHILIGKDIQTSIPDFERIKYNPGGHIVYRYGWFGKQPKLSSSGNSYWYSGDKTLMNFYTEKQAKESIASMNKARVALKNGDEVSAREIIEKELPTFSFSRFKKLFEGDDAFDPDTPFVATRSGARSVDIENILLDDGKPLQNRILDNSRTSLDELGEMNRKFTQERSNEDFLIMNGEDARAHNFDVAPVLDPYQAMELASRNAIDAIYLKDYVRASLEGFAQTFRDIIDDDIRDLWKRPIDFLYNPRYLTNADPGRVGLAETARKTILRQIGNQTPESKFFNYARAKLLEKFNPGSRGFEIAEDYVTPYITDPLTFFRKVAFHLKLGLFNPLQVVVQAQTLAHLLALSPRNAYAAMTAAIRMRPLDLTGEEAVMRFFAGKAKLPGFGGMNEAEFMESYAALKRTGWGIIEGTTATLDDALNPSMFKSRFGKFLHAGRVFFDGIDRYIRLSAWNASYLEWKAANAGRALDDAAIAKIIQRADILSVNMHSSNNAVWAKGLAGVPLQFATYQIRLMEQLLPALTFQKGARISSAEAWRAFALYSALYGIGNGGVSSALGGFFPAGEMLKEAALERGIDLSDSYLEFLQDGIPSVLFEILTGYDLDFATRYAPGGLSVFRDFWMGEMTPGEFLVGPAGQIGGQTIQDGYRTMNGAVSMLMDAFDVEGNEGAYASTTESLMDTLRNISTINQAYNAYYTWNTGKWITKNGVILTDVDKAEGVWAGLLGVVPTRVNDAFLKNNVLKHEKEARLAARKEAVKLFRRGIMRSDPEARAHLIRQAREILIAGGYTQKGASTIMREVLTELPFDESIEQNFWKDFMKQKEQQ